MTKFKVGDRVRYAGNKNGTSMAHHMVGKTGTVTRGSNTIDTNVEWDDKDVFYGYPFNENLELIPVEPKHTAESLTAELRAAIDSGMATDPYWQYGFILTAMEAHND